MCKALLELMEPEINALVAEKVAEKEAEDAAVLAEKDEIISLLQAQLEELKK